MGYSEILLDRSCRCLQFSNSCLHENRKTIEDNCYMTNVIDVIASNMVKSFRNSKLYLLSKFKKYTLGTKYCFTSGKPAKPASKSIDEVSMKGGYLPIHECSRY